MDDGWIEAGWKYFYPFYWRYIDVNICCLLGRDQGGYSCYAWEAHWAWQDHGSLVLWHQWWGRSSNNGWVGKDWWWLQEVSQISFHLHSDKTFFGLLFSGLRLTLWNWATLMRQRNTELTSYQPSFTLKIKYLLYMMKT